jgi:hypothetical protein
LGVTIAGPIGRIDPRFGRGLDPREARRLARQSTQQASDEHNVRNAFSPGRRAAALRVDGARLWRSDGFAQIEARRKEAVRRWPSPIDGRDVISWFAGCARRARA